MMLITEAPPARCGRERMGRYCQFHQEAPPPVAEPELFSDVYSPAAIGFWLVDPHYTALINLARGDGRGDEADYLAYEWALVRSGERLALEQEGRLHGRNPAYCLCAHLHALEAIKKTSAYPQFLRSRGSSGDARSRAARTQADLEQAADALPLHWRTTKTIYAIQRRPDVLKLREAELRAGLRQTRPQDMETEPAGSYSLCLQRMAMARGWRTNRKVI